jgi:hypothetical protein
MSSAAGNSAEGFVSLHRRAANGDMQMPKPGGREMLKPGGREMQEPTIGPGDFWPTSPKSPM